MAETSTLNGTMKPIPYLLLAALALPLGACSMAPSFDVRVVDSATGAPIGGAAVEMKTTHFRWPKRWDDFYTFLGKTDNGGKFTVGSLDLDSKTHRLDFSKMTYRDMYVFVRNLDGKDVYLITDGLGDKTRSQPIAGSPTVEIRMTRGIETRKRHPPFPKKRP